MNQTQCYEIDVAENELTRFIQELEVNRERRFLAAVPRDIAFKDGVYRVVTYKVVYVFK